MRQSWWLSAETSFRAICYLYLWCRIIHRVLKTYGLGSSFLRELYCWIIICVGSRFIFLSNRYCFPLPLHRRLALPRSVVVFINSHIVSNRRLAIVVIQDPMFLKDSYFITNCFSLLFLFQVVGLWGHVRGALDHVSFDRARCVHLVLADLFVLSNSSGGCDELMISMIIILFPLFVIETSYSAWFLWDFCKYKRLSYFYFALSLWNVDFILISFWYGLQSSPFARDWK